MAIRPDEFTPFYSGNKILVVDDNNVNLALMKRVLANNGYVADAANHGSNAIEWAKVNQYVLILMDAEMPVKNGGEASNEIFKLYAENGHHVTIVAQSSVAELAKFKEIFEKVLANTDYSKNFHSLGNKFKKENFSDVKYHLDRLGIQSSKLPVKAATIVRSVSMVEHSNTKSENLINSTNLRFSLDSTTLSRSNHATSDSDLSKELSKLDLDKSSSDQ